MSEERVIDAEIIDEQPKPPSNADKQWAEYGQNIATIFADEPKPIEAIFEESRKKFGYGQNLVRITLTWLEEHKLATSKLRGGVLYWGKPIDVRKLVEAAAFVADVVAGPVEAIGGEKAARVMREAANAARTVAPAVDGIKREAKPVTDAFKKLGAAAKEAGFFRLRDPIDVQIANRRAEAARKESAK